MNSILFAIYFSAIWICVSGRQQNITIKGFLQCNDKPLNGTKIELWEKDFPDPDDYYGSTITDQNGYFKLSGGEEEYFNINPYIIISHSCACTPECSRTTKHKIPTKFINQEYNVYKLSMNAHTYSDVEICKEDD